MLQVRTSSACSTFKRMRECIPRAKFQISSYWSIPSERILSYSGQDMSGQNKSARDKELICRKAEHLSVTDGFTDGISWSMCFNQKWPFHSKLFITNRVLANSIRIWQEIPNIITNRVLANSMRIWWEIPNNGQDKLKRAYVMWSIFRQWSKRKGTSQASASYLIFYEAVLQAIYGHLLVRASYSQQQSRTGLEITGCFEQNFRALSFSTTDYSYPSTLLGYFFDPARLFFYLWEKRFQQDTSRAQSVKRS